MHVRPAGSRQQVPRDVPAYLLLFLAALVANMFSGHTSSLGLPVGPDRLLLAAALVLLFLDPVAWRATTVRWGLVHGVMAALVLLAAWSASAHDTLTTRLGLFALLDRLFVPFLLFTVAPVVFCTRERRNLLLWVLLAMGAYLGLTAIFEYVGPGRLVYPSYIADPDVGIHFGRARGPFVEAVADGVVLSFCGFAAAGCLLAWRGPAKVFAAAVAAVTSLGVLLTLTRSVWLGAVVGAVLVLVITPETRRKVPAALAAGAVAVLAALALIPGLNTAAADRTKSERPVQDRKNTNAAAVRIVQAKPLTGVGWERFIDVSSEWVRQADDYPITSTGLEVHNVVLARGAELGLPGAGLWVGAVLLGPVAAGFLRPAGEGRALRVALLGGGCCWLSASLLSPLGTSLPNLLLWTLAGVVAGTRIRE